jgi:hypothetical protein
LFVLSGKDLHVSHLRKLVVAGLAAAMIGGSFRADETEVKEKPKTVPAAKIKAPVKKPVPAPRKVIIEEPKVTSEGTHKQIEAIKVSGKQAGGTLQTLCIGPSGKVYGLVGAGRYAAPASTIVGKTFSRTGAISEVQVFDAAGKYEANLPLDFNATAVTVAPDGTVYVGGDGKIASFDAKHKSLGTVEAPYLKALLADTGGIRKRAEARKDQMVSSYKQMLTNFEKQLETAKAAEKKKKEAKDKSGDAKEPEEGDESDAVVLGGIRNSVQQLESMIKMYRQMHDQQAKRPVEDYMSELTKQVRLTVGIAADEKHLYVACGETKGFGYGIWRMTRDLKDEKQVLSGVSGCCGQMDVQCCKDGFILAENTKHRVAVYDSEGKFLRAFGKRDRESDGDSFGGCCNPMNTRPTSGGDVYTAESEGFIKRWSADGKFQELVCQASLSGGCKNVAVAVSKDGSTVYFCDLPGSRILIHRRKDLITAQAN